MSLFREGEIAKVKEIRGCTGLSLREALDLCRRFDGDVPAAIANVNNHPGGSMGYVSPEQKCRDAIKKYYAALDNREHGGVAVAKAFAEIEAALDMQWVQGATLKKEGS
jgi:hypothetical protein